MIVWILRAAALLSAAIVGLHLWGVVDGLLTLLVLDRTWPGTASPRAVGGLVAYVAAVGAAGSGFLALALWPLRDGAGAPPQGDPSRPAAPAPQGEGPSS